VTEAAPVPEPVPAAPVAAQPAPAAEEAPRRAKKEVPEGEIVVSSTAAPADDEAPKKKGWWNRGFFGG
jgi:ribonuclease E